jgi:hypothetical protein
VNSVPGGAGGPPICPDQHVLLADGVGDVRHGQAEFGQLVRLDPDAHRVLECRAAGDLGLADTADAGQFVEHVDGCVIGKELLVVGAVR